MPKLFVHAPQGTFTAKARAGAAAALTDLGIACERLADTPKVRAGSGCFSQSTEKQEDPAGMGHRLKIQEE